MNEVTIASSAKINLFLELLGRRQDGYFQIETVLQEIDLHDDISIKNKQGAGIDVKVLPSLSISKEENIAYKAAELLCQKTGRDGCGVQIFIEKRIPVGRGLGGGSSNAAAVLKGLNELWELGLSREELAKLGAELGMDVPFFIYGGTCLGTQRGEIVEPLEGFSGVDIVIFWPDFPVSTAEVYGKVSRNLTRTKRSAKFLIDCLKAKDFDGIDKNIFNRLENVALKIYPSLAGFKEKISPFSANKIIMSGSGSAFFSVLRGKLKNKKNLFDELRKLKGGCYIGKTL